MVLPVSNFPLDVSRTVFETNGLILAIGLSLSKLQVLLDGALRLSIVHEACPCPSSLPTVLAISQELPLQALDVGTLGRRHEDRYRFRVFILDVFLSPVLNDRKLAVILPRALAAFSLAFGKRLLTRFLDMS